MTDEEMKFAIIKQTDIGQPQFQGFFTVEVKHSQALCVFESLAAAEAFLLHAGISGEGWQIIDSVPEEVVSIIERLMDWADMGYVVVNPLPRRYGRRAANHSHNAAHQYERRAIHLAHGEVEPAWDFVHFLRREFL